MPPAQVHIKLSEIKLAMKIVNIISSKRILLPKIVISICYKFYIDNILPK